MAERTIYVCDSCGRDAPDGSMQLTSDSIYVLDSGRWINKAVKPTGIYCKTCFLKRLGIEPEVRIETRTVYEDSYPRNGPTGRPMYVENKAVVAALVCSKNWSK